MPRAAKKPRFSTPVISCPSWLRMALILPFLIVITAGIPFKGAQAITDSAREIPSTVPNWNFTGQYMDTGNVRSCRATGAFGEYTIAINAVPEAGHYGGGYGFACDGMCDSITIGFKSSRPYAVGKSRGLAPSDYGTCATGRPTDAPAGTLHGNLGYAPYVDLCDGAHDWHAVNEKTQPVELSLGGKSAITGEAVYIIDLKIGTPFIYSFSAEFWPKDMLAKFQNASRLKVSAREGDFQPVELKDVRLNQVASVLQRCLKGEK